MVVSVPKCNKCLSLSETIVKIEAVGLFGITVALVLTPVPALGAHEKVLPFLIVAINNSPKLSKDQFPAAISVLDVVLGVPHVDRLHVPAPHPYASVAETGPTKIIRS